MSVGLPVRLRPVAAHHEAGHAVAAVMRGGYFTQCTVDPPETHVLAWDRPFCFFAGMWAQARYSWAQRDDDDDDPGDDESTSFEAYLTAVYAGNLDGDVAELELCDAEDEWRAEEIAEAAGVTVDDVRDRRERAWVRDLERVWPAIQRVAGMLLAGQAVTPEVVADILG